MKHTKVMVTRGMVTKGQRRRADDGVEEHEAHQGHGN